MQSKPLVELCITVDEWFNSVDTKESEDIELIIKALSKLTCLKDYDKQRIKDILERL